MLLGEEEWLVGRPSTEMEQGGDTLMSLGLDLMGESTSQSDTAMGFMDNMEAAPKLSSLVSERRVHHAPNSPNSTVVQSNPNAQTTQTGLTSQDSFVTETESKSSLGTILGGLALVVAIGGVIFMQGGNQNQEQTEKQPTEQVAQNNAPVAEKQNTPQTKVEEPAADAKVENTEPKEVAKVETPKPKASTTKTTSKTTKPKEAAAKSTSTKSSATKAQSTNPSATAKPQTKTTPKTQAVETKPVAQPVQNTKPAVAAVSGSTGKIVFEKQGAVDSVYLVGSNGKKYNSGVRVPVGDYAIKVKCGGKVSGAGKHTVQENKTTTYLCNCMMKTCSRK